MTSFVSEGLTPGDIEMIMPSWMPGIAEGFEQWRQAFRPGALGKPPG